MLLHVGKVSPRVAQRGTTVEVTIQGMCIKDAQEIIFYRPGIKAISIEALPNIEPPMGLMHGGRIQEQIKCKFEIAIDCAPGEYPFRIRTHHELSSLGTFHVTPFLTIDETEKGYNANDSLETALEVAPNTTVRGELGNSGKGDVDLYRVKVTKGTRLSVEVDSVKIADAHYGGSEYDVALRILDEEGKELASNDDNAIQLQDPLASVRIAKDGFAFVEIQRSLFVPDSRVYAVHIGTNKRPLIGFPLGGRSGTKQSVLFLGDPLGEFTQAIDIPTAPGTFDLHLGGPSPLRFRSSPLSNVYEKRSLSINEIESLPIAINGVLFASGEQDRYGFRATKGNRYRIRVYAASLGSPIDPKINIRKVNETDGSYGKIELESDDVPPADRDIFGTSFRGQGGLKDTSDPSVIWEVKDDGAYVLEIADRGGSFGRTAVYRIEIEHTTDSIHTLLASTAFDWMECVRTSGLAIPRGNRWTINVVLPEGQGNSFRGETQIIAEGLPEGVTMVAPPVPAGRNQWPVQFSAHESAKVGAFVARLRVTPMDNTKTLRSSSNQSLPFINHSGGDAWRTVLLDRYAMAVTDPAPFHIEVDMPSTSLVRGGELAIPVRVIRHDGFNESIEFQCDWVPPGIAVQPTTTIPGDQSEGLMRISGEANAPLGTFPFVITASTTREDLDAYLGTGRIRVSSEIYNLKITEPYVELTSVPESVRRGATKPFIWKVQHKNPFEGSATVKLLGLPKGVTLVEPLPVITASSTEIAFNIAATQEALMGRVSGLSCEVIVNAAGQEIRQRTGNGTLRIDPSLE